MKFIVIDLNTNMVVGVTSTRKEAKSLVDELKAVDKANALKCDYQIENASNDAELQKVLALFDSKEIKIYNE